MGNPEIIWRGRRYWVTEPVMSEHYGWNTSFVPYYVVKETTHRVTVKAADGDAVQFARKDWESKGKIYHSKHHEYFYRAKPEVDPEKQYKGWNWSYEQMRDAIEGDAKRNPFAALGLSGNPTKQQVKQAYKRLARKAHPDGGGSHEAFLKLNKVYELAMSIAI